MWAPIFKGKEATALKNVEIMNIMRNTVEITLDCLLVLEGEAAFIKLPGRAKGVERVRSAYVNIVPTCLGL